MPAPFTGRVCVTGTGTNHTVHYHGYVERRTGRQLILRRRRDGRPHRFRADAPHTSIPAVAAGPLTAHPRCARPKERPQ